MSTDQADEQSKPAVSRWFDITQAAINTFADVTHDPQFIHVDPERAAAETPFGGTIAHGFLTLSLLSAMAEDALPGVDNLRMGINYGFNKVRFLSPVPSGARVRGHFTLAEREEKQPGEHTIIFNVIVEIEGAEKPALAADWIVRHYY